MDYLNVKKMPIFQNILVLIFSIQISFGSMNSTYRKHKVHNIVLYPDKHSWCSSTPIKQVISETDCESVEIDNRVCLGACFSYSIPTTLPANNGNNDEVNSYCDSCQPIKTSWMSVKLTCNGGLNQTKHIQLIKECKCSSCSRHWEFVSPSPLVDVDDEENSTQTSRYLELMKLNQDENADDEDANTTDVSNSEVIILSEILDSINSTRLVYEKNVWIRGPHHSKVLMKKEMVNIPKIAINDNQQYLGEDTVDKNKL